MSWLTASVVAEPNAESWANTVTFLPAAAAEVRARREHVLMLCRPERNVYLLIPVIASLAAGPEMNRILFCVGERRDLKGDARGDAAGEDLVALADQVLRRRDGLDRVGPRRRRA